MFYCFALLSSLKRFARTTFKSLPIKSSANDSNNQNKKGSREYSKNGWITGFNEVDDLCARARKQYIIKITIVRRCVHKNIVFMTMIVSLSSHLFVYVLWAVFLLFSSRLPFFAVFVAAGCLSIFKLVARWEKLSQFFSFLCKYGCGSHDIIDRALSARSLSKYF